MLFAWFGLVFILTWALWFGAAGMDASLLRGLVFNLGVFTPGVVALLFTLRQRGATGVSALLKRLVQWEVGGRWYAFSLLFMLSIKLLVALTLRVSTGAWPRFGDTPLPLMIFAAIGSTMIGGQVGEELGWRGYALPRLARRLGLAPAALLLGVIWAAWHLPLFFIYVGDTVGQSFPFYLLQVTALSVAIAWLYMKSGCSLLLTMLLHAAINNTKDIVPSALPAPGNSWLLFATPVGWLTLLLLWLCATYFLVQMRGNTSVAECAS